MIQIDIKGLAGSGKTTLAYFIYQKLNKAGFLDVSIDDPDVTALELLKNQKRINNLKLELINIKTINIQQGLKGKK